MDILLYEANLLQKGMIEFLTGLKEVSLYMSISVEDTLRILREVHPDTVIIGGNMSLHQRFIQSLMHLYPGLSIYLCSDREPGNPQFYLTNYRNKLTVSLQNFLENAQTTTEPSGIETIHKTKP